MSASPLTDRACTLGALSLTLLALAMAPGAPLGLAAADGDGGGAAVSRTPADQEAEGLYVQGRREQEEGRMDDAIRHLEEASRLQPANEQYQKALSAARAQAGVDRDPRAETVNRMADEQAVKQQQLWVEAEAKADEGTKLMEAGSYDEAERAFEMAEIRLENLPFADDRRAGELRKVQALTKEAESRRETKEQQDAAARNQQALDRQQQLRDVTLKIERDRIDAMLQRAERARQRRDFDEAILLCEQVLKINRAEDRASSLLATCRRERHVYLRQMTADRWDEEHRLLSEQIRTAMLPQLEIITYSPDWAELDARRTAPTRGLEEEHETWRKTINDQLEQEVTLDFSDTDLADVVAFLQRITSVNIVLDPKVTAATPPPVTLKVEKMKLKYVLDFIMKLSGLNYVLRDEAIFISNTEGVRGDIYMKLYDVRDLTHAMQSFPGPELDIPEPGGQGAKLLPPIQQEDAPETSEFIDIIQKVVAPDRWTREGVSIEEYNGSMVVTQTSDVHKQVEELLRALRNQRGTQIHVKVRFLEIENSALEEIGVNWNNFTGPAIPSVAPLTPLPGQNTATTNTQTTGAYYANPTTGTIAAAALNNQLQPYQTQSSLKYSNNGSEGLNFNTQAWKVANNVYASAVLNAVEKERKGNVIFEPDLTMFNGQQAHIVNMNQQAYVADYNVVQGQYDPIITVLSYGTVLDVQAIASADKKYITLTMRPTNAQVVQWRRFGPVTPGLASFPGGTVVQSGQAIGTSSAANGGGVNQLSGNGIGFNPILIPELKYESVRTSVTIPDGGSLVLAGMTNGESAHAHSGIPFLSHIPFLGRLFSSNGRQDTELKTMIVVQADVVLFEEIEKSL